jgi:hypothetical protein
MVCALGASAQVNFDYITSTDTLTNAATYYVTLGKTYTQAGTVECGCTATNLSGTTAATALIQVSHSPAGTNFVDANTDTLTIANGTASVTSATLNGYKARLKVVGSGTQSTKIVTGCTYKKAN